MAVIQDLPAETLYHILELGAEDPDCFRGRDLCSTALVARAWRQPSQELLVYEWWSPHLSKSYDTPPLPARRVRYTLIHSLEAAAGARRLIERHGTLLSRLDVYSDRSASDLNFLLVKGAKHLSLRGTVEGDFTFPDGTYLALRSLYLSSVARLPASAPQQLIARTPHLTRLELDSNSLFDATDRTPFLVLAAQLRHVTLTLSYSRPGHSGPEVLLRACTSLVSLDLQRLTPGHLPTLLSSIPTQLVVVSCSFDGKACGNESVASDLLEAVDQPALSSLKRWRWGNRFQSMDFTGQSLFPYLKTTVGTWEAACRARGIEPRGEERYFTD